MPRFRLGQCRGRALVDDVIGNIVEGSVIEIIELRIELLIAHQFGVVAALDQFAVLQNDDAVCLANGSQTVGNHQSCAAFQKLDQRLLDQHLGIAVDIGGGLIEHEDLRVRDQRAGKADELPLTE